MSAVWYPPREDSPSVVSNRVFAIRRLNKMASQRLGSELNSLDAEVIQAKSMIEKEQEALKKELAQIQEVKSNPMVSIERRKLQQQTSSSQIRMGRSRFPGEANPVPTIFRSLSTGHLTMQRSRIFSSKEKERKLEITCPPLSSVRERPTGTRSCQE